jgi:hypothetical protein
MHATLAIWLVAAMAAIAAGQAVQSSSFNFPFSMYFLQTAAAWAIARAAVLVLNLQLDMGEPAQHAAATSQDAEPSKQQQLMFAGLLLGGSMAAQALVQTFEASSSPATAVFKVGSKSASKHPASQVPPETLDLGNLYSFWFMHECAVNKYATQHTSSPTLSATSPPTARCCCCCCSAAPRYWSLLSAYSCV